MKILLDGNKYSNKLEILKLFQFHLKEMYSLNYDALIDVLSELKEPIEIEIINYQNIQNFNEFKDVLDIICNDNSNIKYIAILNSKV